MWGMDEGFLLGLSRRGKEGEWRVYVGYGLRGTVCVWGFFGLHNRRAEFSIDDAPWMSYELLALTTWWFLTRRGGCGERG